MFTDNYSMICIFAGFCAHLWLFQLLTDRCATVFGVGLTLTNFCCWLDHLYTNWCNTTKIFRLSCWRFKSSGTWSCVTEQVGTHVLTAIWSPNMSVTTCPNSAGGSSVWHYSCLRTSSLCPVPPRSHYGLNQFICNITILSRGMIQCFSCWIAATEIRHHTVSIRCMLLYRVFLTRHISCNATHLQCGTIRPYYMWMCYP